MRNIRAVALRTVKYNDSSSILSAWSAELGRISILMPAATSRESRRRRALTMPLSLFEGEADLRPGREIINMRDMRASVIAPTLTSNPVKVTLAMFLADVLESLLRTDAMGDETLYAVIADSVRALDSLRNPRALANFHLWFLYRLTVAMGIEPDVGDYAPHRVFDMRAACYRPSAPAHTDWLTGAESAYPRTVSRMTARTLARWSLTAAQRSQALDLTIKYFALHNLPLTPLRTLPVLRTIL